MLKGVMCPDCLVLLDSKQAVEGDTCPNCGVHELENVLVVRKVDVLGWQRKNHTQVVLSVAKALDLVNF